MEKKELVTIFKVLSNESRLQILEWLKKPKEQFDQERQGEIDMDEVGVCVSQITEKLKMTQSTASEYLSMLQKSKLLTATRIGKWTYFKRDNIFISEVGVYFSKEL